MQSFLTKHPGDHFHIRGWSTRRDRLPGAKGEGERERRELTNKGGRTTLDRTAFFVEGFPSTLPGEKFFAVASES